MQANHFLLKVFLVLWFIGGSYSVPVLVHAEEEDPVFPEYSYRQTVLSTRDRIGGFNHTIPIETPPGRDELQPDLQLTYNSQDILINNLFGYGWSVNVPYIQRINKKGSESLYSDYYFFSSLDGELATTTGIATTTSFAPRVENGSFLSYSLTNNVWTIYDKKGTRYSFGITTNSRQDNPSDSSEVYTWFLEEVRDTNDNYVKYEYDKDNGQVYPSTITYTGHGTTDGPFAIDFLRTSRTDVATSTAPGFEVISKYVINEIDVQISGTTTRKYELSHSTGESGERLLLQSITETGYADDGALTTLPVSTFSYATSTKTWTENGNFTIPFVFDTSGTEDQGVRLGDVNGDGLLDIIRSSYNGTNIKEVYINDGDGTGWTLDNNYSIPINFSEYSDMGVILDDVNGDGLVDILQSFISFTSQEYNRLYLNKGDGTGWELQASTTIPVTFLNYRTYLGVQLGDVNGDGLTDLVQSAVDGTHYHDGVYLNDGDGTGWTLDSNYSSMPLYFNDPGDTGARLVDVNNDGLADILYSKDPYGVPGRESAIYLNKGDGTGWDLVSTTTLPFAFVASNLDHGTRLADINDDGLIDVVYSNNSSAYPGFEQGVYINNGKLEWGEDEDTDYVLPAVEFAYNGYDNGLRILDIDGDRLPDFVRAFYDSSDHKAAYVHDGLSADLVERVATSEGAITTVIYKGTPEYQSGGVPANGQLPLVLTTVESVGISDGFGNVATTTYSYGGGLYYFNDSYDRKFAGFATTTTTNAAGHVTKEHAHQGDASNSSQGEYNDHVSKIGKVYRTEEYDDSSNLYRKTITEWDKYNQGTDRDFVKKAQVVTFSYDGDGDHKDKAESFTSSNTNGNLTQKIEWGEVTGSDDGTFTDTGSDKRTTDISYATDGTYVVGLPSQETITNQSGTKVKEARHYYDGLTLGNADEGNETKTSNWKTGTTYLDTLYSYNSYGLVATSTDPRGNSTGYVYDPFNLYVATTTNAVGHITGRTYDYSSGKTKLTVDPNGLQFEITYDGLDRPLTEKQPDISTPSTLVNKKTYSYTDTVGSRKVLETNYLDSSVDFTLYTYLDGLDRKIQTRKEAEISNEFSVKDFAYNNLGLLQKEPLPYFSSGSSKTTASTNTVLYSSYLYDPLKRITAISTAVGTTTNTYDQWVTTVADPESNYKDLTHDAYGNLAQVVEHEGINNYTTLYTYDAVNDLATTTDADGNIRRFTYDGLGRRLSAEDLHDTADGTYGSWIYTYDDAGNLTSRIDPKSQTVNFTYDDINRALTENYTGGVGTEVTYTYDSCTNGIGRLCSAVMLGSATTTLTYNALGLIATSTKTISGTAYATGFTYDRQGNTSLLSYPNAAQTRYTYNTAGLLEKVEHKGNGEPSFATIINKVDYSPTEAVSFKQFGNAVESTYTYDATKLYRLTNIFTIASSTWQGGGPLGVLDWAHFATSPLQSILARATLQPLAVQLLLEEGGVDLLLTEQGTTTTPEVLTVEEPTATTTSEETATTSTEFLTNKETTATTTESTITISTTTPSAPEQAPEMAAEEVTSAEESSEKIAEEQIVTELPRESVGTFVEVPGLRTPNSESYRRINAGGSEFKTKFYAGDVYYKSSSTELFEPIDTTLTAKSPGGWEMNKAEYQATLPHRLSEAPITFRNNRLNLTISTPAEKLAPNSGYGTLMQNSDERAVRYADALGFGIDLEIELTNEALYKNVVINDLGSLGDIEGKEHVEFPFTLTIEEGVSVLVNGEELKDGTSVTTDREAVIVGAEGQKIYLWSPIARDSARHLTNISIRYERVGNTMYLIKIVPAQWLRDVTYPVRTDTVVSYYSNSGGDGEIYKGGSLNWNTEHDATSGTADGSGTTAYTYSEHDGSTYWLGRTALPFDTSGLPDGATITNVNLKVYVSAKSDGDNDGSDFIRVVQNTTASATALANGDYDQIGAIDNPTAGATDTDITGVSTGGYLTINLNSTGRGWVSKTSYTKLGLREGHDATDAAPTSGTGITGLQIRTANYTGTASDPILEVTYTEGSNSAPTAPTSLLAEGETNPTNISDPTPEFSAIYNDPDSGDLANRYRIQVATSSSFVSTYWDSGTTTMATTTAGNRSSDLSYAGSALASSTTYYWRIKFSDDDGATGAWSTTTSTFSLAASGGGGGLAEILQNIFYTYDNVGNITNITDYSDTGTGKVVLFGYDDLYRLTSASTTAASSTPFSHSYAYSAIGNITSKSDIGSYTYGETGYANPHAVTQVANGLATTTYSYDNNGNITGAGNWTYTWDYRNRLAASGNGSATTTYGYDHENQRVKKATGGITTAYPNKYFNTTGATSTAHIFTPSGEMIATVELVSSGGGGTPTTTSFYAGSGGDGEIYKGGSSNWTIEHDATSGTAEGSATTAYTYVEHDGSTYWIARTALPFDTSSIPDNATITAATLKVYVDAKSDGDNDGSDFVRVVQNTTASATALADGDYDQIGSIDNPTAGASDTDITGVSTGAYLSIPLNATGLGWISKTSYTKLGLREGHDATDVAPGNSTGITGLQIRTADYTGTASDPILEITYETGGGATSTATTTSYMHGDHLGGMNVSSDENGLVREVVDYYPYGTQRVSKTFNATPEQRKFSGLEYDSESDLTYASARYYDQDIGKFLSQDPVFINLGVDERTQAALANPQLQNAYSYGANNPVKNTDKEGEFIDTALDIAFIGYDLYSLGRAALTGGDVKTEAAALAADVAGAFIPFGTGFGLGVRAIRAADNAADAARAAQRLPDSALVCRGGTCSTNQFKNAKGATLDASGKLEGVSVNSGADASLLDLTRSLPHNQVGVTTVGDVRKIGGDVLPSPRLNGSNPNPFHSTLQGVTPQQAEQLFKPTVPNPSR